MGISYYINNASTNCFAISTSNCASGTAAGTSTLTTSSDPLGSYFRSYPNAADQLASSSYTTGCLNAFPYQYQSPDTGGYPGRYVKFFFTATTKPQYALYSDSACNSRGFSFDAVMPCTNQSSPSLAVFSSQTCVAGSTGAVVGTGSGSNVVHVGVVLGTSEAVLSFTSYSTNVHGWVLQVRWRVAVPAAQPRRVQLMHHARATSVALYRIRLV